MQKEKKSFMDSYSNSPRDFFRKPFFSEILSETLAAIPSQVSTNILCYNSPGLVTKIQQELFFGIPAKNPLKISKRCFL